MNARNEATLDAGNEEGREKLFSNNTKKVVHPEVRVNGVAMPPAGFEFADVHEGEPSRLEPVVLHPTLIEVPLFSRERIAIAIAKQAIRWTKGDESKLAVYDSVLGDDRRPICDVIETAGCSTRTFFRYLAELRGLIEEWRSELGVE